MLEHAHYSESNIRLDLDDDNIEFTIGMIYAIIYFYCRVIPIDIEITLAYNKDLRMYEINVFDFGMTIDIDNPIFNTERAVDFGNLITHEYRVDTLNQQLIKQVKKNIDIDLYCELPLKGLPDEIWDTQQTLNEIEFLNTLISLKFPIDKLLSLKIYSDRKGFFEVS